MGKDAGSVSAGVAPGDGPIRSRYGYDMADRERRIKWLFKPRKDVLEDIDVDLLDPDNEDDRHLLIASEHPQIWKALEQGESEIELRGEPVDCNLHLAMHQIVANRILADTPPEFWETAQRLTRQGFRRHDVLHMLGSVVSEEVYTALKDNAVLSDQQVRKSLWQLPGDWPKGRTTHHPERRRR